jgi:hypothetical protein
MQPFSTNDDTRKDKNSIKKREESHELDSIHLVDTQRKPKSQLDFAKSNESVLSASIRINNNNNNKKSDSFVFEIPDTDHLNKSNESLNYDKSHHPNHSTPLIEITKDVNATYSNRNNSNTNSFKCLRDEKLLSPKSPDEKSVTYDQSSPQSQQSRHTSFQDTVENFNEDDDANYPMVDEFSKDLTRKNIEINDEYIEILNQRGYSYSYLKSYIVNMIEPSDNKLAMKLFGSKKGVLKEKLRQKGVGQCIIHPCSNFR